MLNCRKAAELMSQGLDRKLGTLQRIGLRLHLLMCSGCRNFDKQMNFLRDSCRKFPQQDS
ncbi:MAG: zf-HC2 domain-containing protein [Burkholderiales bacterium]|nr:zf-HC2 domain-containing protein [Burkholderiales bacterium]